ncbi:MAG: DNA polymerase II large subunit [Candidatus Woesearchaeota archaeon]
MTSIKASQNILNYFEEIEQKTKDAYRIATEARKKGYDPEKKVDIVLAKDMAERVEGLISAVAPQLVGKGVIKRIKELEEKYGRLSWEVALKIALEVAQEKFCKFKDLKEAMEVGIRTGFTYHTVGIVSAPLEGLVEIKIKKRRDGKDYLALIFAGPIRGAGGTAASFSLMIADYVRKNLGIDKYDPDEREISRYAIELQDYHERVTNLQYRPSDEETKFLAMNIPVEVDGEPTEKIDVSNYKGLQRVETDKIRGGVCLVMSMLALKAPKLWKEVKKWGKEFGMEHWQEFLEKFIELQKKHKSGSEKNEQKQTHKLTPDFTYLSDIVAGRPVFSQPLAKGGFRLRYGRSRLSGYSAASIHPATAHILNKFIATGTQLKTERPSKGAAISMCNTIEGPIVKLNNGDVLRIDSEFQAKQLIYEIEEILFLGDILFCYGDFLDRAHILVPAGYCEEWWVQELEKAIVDYFGNLDEEKLAELSEIPLEEIHTILKNPNHINFKRAKTLSEILKIPLHPKFTYHWKELSKQDFLKLVDYIDTAKVEKSEEPEKIILPLKKEKRLLELIGLPHKVAIEYVIIEGDEAAALLYSLGILNPLDLKVARQKISEASEENNGVEIVNLLSKFRIRDKSGTFIGARMGRPEKAKMRKLTGAPHSLFPCGNEGGRLRCFQSAMEAGYVEADFPTLFCENCKTSTVLNVCHKCGKESKKIYRCNFCGQITQPCSHSPKSYVKQKIKINEYIENTLKILGETHCPDLVKGVRGTSNKDHIPEHIAKGILRAKHQICVNKDGTTRYDMTELPITHFRPKEIGTSLEKLKKLGYEKDIYGMPLESEDQLLELKPQDVILPASPDSPDEKASDILLRVANFVDELLIKLYKMEPFYNAKKKEDLIGHLVIGLAPHISAGIIGRIIGFSETQTCLGHPLWHAAHRRDCDGDENCVILLMDAFLNFSRQYLPDKRGGRTMDAPLVLTYILNPSEVDDMIHKMDVVSRYPLEFYEACLEYKNAWEVKIEKVGDRLGNESQYEGIFFTHDTDNLNSGVKCSAYKILPTMEEKIKGQMEIAKKVRAVNEEDVAHLVIEKHLIKDVRGNLRKFSMQKFRCSTCNESYRRPPLAGKCLKCGGKIIFTISEGSIVKYLEPSITLAKKYVTSNYLSQILELTRRRIESVFGKQKDKQTGISNWLT